MFLDKGGTLGVVWLIITGSLVLADSTNDGDGELEYFRSETACKASQSLLAASAEWQAELIYCTKEKTETELCKEIKAKLKQECLKVEEMFNKALYEEVDDIEGDFITKISLLNDVLVEFYRFELENGKSIRDCVEKSGVPRQWVLNDNQKGDASCVGTELTFLTNPLKQHCRHSWISLHHRSKFYQQCLQNFTMENVRRKALSATRNLENIASVFKTEMIDKGVHKVAGGSTMIAGGILGGAGLLLSATGPIGLTLVGVGAALGIAGSVTTMFGKDSTNTVQEAHLQMTQLRDLHNTISNLLVLYGESIKNLTDFETRFVGQSRAVMDRIERKYLDNSAALYTTGLDTVKLTNAALDMERIRRGSEATILTRIVQRMYRSKKILKFGETFSSVAARAKTISGAKHLGAFMSKAWTSSGNFVKYGAPAFDIAVGIYQVIGGVKKMKPMFNHQIISASRAISKETDDLIEVYYKLLNGNVPSKSLDEFHTIYSIDLEVKEGNWDYYSGVYFIFSNGQEECNTKGSGYKSLSTGWVTLNISNGNGLNDCLFFEFFNDNLNVSVVHHQNTGLQDQVTISTIQVSVDGNYLPSFEIDHPITVAHGRQSDFLSVKPMNRMLKAIKTHTSELWTSGTDSNVYMTLKLYDNDTALTQRPEWFPLDNEEDNFERGQTDIFRGSSLKKAKEMIRDFLEFYPETAEVEIILSMRKYGVFGTWGPAWNTDLLKLYFAGKNGKNVVLRCYAGERWIYDNDDRIFKCKKLEDKNPAKSIEMFEAHTCDFALSGSSSKLMKLKFCQKRDQFRSFEKSSKTLDCCSTNYFPLGSTRNEWKRYDLISRSDTLDGGEVLGQCEGFDLLGTEIYVAMENGDGDMGCFDQLDFYGIPNNGSTQDLAFASCHFNPVMFDSSAVTHYENGGWTTWANHMNEPARCEFSVQTNSITRLNIKVCESSGSGSRDPMYIELKNDNGDVCKTEGLPVNQQGHFLRFSSGSLGSCKNFIITETTTAKLSNDGRDDLCLTDLYLDTASQDGATRVLRCRYNADTHQSMIVHGEARTIPLLCY